MNPLELWREIVEFCRPDRDEERALPALEPLDKDDIAEAWNDYGGEG